jgi:HEAT repeat protein
MILHVLLALVLPMASQDESGAQIRALLEKLRSDSAAEREAATRSLKQVGRAALPALEEASRDRDPEVAARAQRLRRAIDVLVTLPASVFKAIPGIEDRLAGSDHAWTVTFLELTPKDDVPRSALHPLAARALREAQTGEEIDQVLRGIGRRCLHHALPEVLRLVREDRLGRRNEALLLLSDLDLPESVPDILKLVNRSDALLLERTARALADLRSKKAVPLFLPLLKDEDPDVREIAFTTLASLDVRDIKPEILAKLGKVSDFRELLTAGSLALRYELKEAIPVLRERLPKLSRDDQQTAAGYLLQLGDKEAFALMATFLADADERNHEAAAEELARFGGRAYFGEIARLLRHPDPDTRTHALALLTDLEARDRLDEIAPLAQDGLQPGGKPRETVEVRSYAIRALASLGGRDRLPAIERALTDPEGLVRGTAAVALARLGVKEKIPQIAELLAHPNWAEQKYAAEALAILGARDQAPAIARLLGDRDVEVRKAAAEALHALGALPTGDKVAAALFAGVEPQQVQGAAETLCRVGLPEGVPIVLQICSDVRLALQDPPTGQMRWVSRKSLELLNAVREPAAWKRLATTPAPAAIEGTRRELIERLAKDAGLQVIWSPAAAWEEDRWILGRERLPAKPQTLLGTLILLLSVHGVHQPFPERCQFILEGDRLRVLRSAEALDAWEAWWESRKK